MSAVPQPIIVGIDDSSRTESVLRWAVDDALARRLPLRLVYAFHWEYARVPAYFEVPEIELRASREAADQVIAEAVEVVRALDRRVDVDSEAVQGPPAQILIDASASASELVLGSRNLKALGSSTLGSVGAAVSARAACPVVVMRGASGVAEEGAGVVIGVDDTEVSEKVLEFGFDYASRHRLPVRPVLCWHPDLLALRSWRAEPPTPTRVEAWLSEALAGWREKYPDVEVHYEVIRDHPIAGLVLASAAQHMLVVGSRGRHALAGTLLGSVSQGALHHATCPVAVVPAHH